ncbi:MAG TPA: hypothetical protein VFT34_04815 [Verrucomicrobiae bacterium]|nr:hypothetical protein [Verrucomicrobiae bacterium]
MNTNEHEFGQSDGGHGFHSLARIHPAPMRETRDLDAACRIRVHSCPFVVQEFGRLSIGRSQAETPAAALLALLAKQTDFRGVKPIRNRPI